MNRPNYNMPNSKPIPQRKVAIELIRGQIYNNGKWTGIPETVAYLENIQVEFAIHRFRCGTRAHAEISIANLSNSLIQLFSTFASQSLALQAHNRLRLWAGFENQNFSLLYDGDIVRALPTMPPDIILNCECIDGYYANFNTASVYSQGKTYKDIVAEIAAKLNINYEYRATNKTQITGFLFEGSVSDFPNVLNELGGVVAWFENGLLIVDDCYPRQKNSTDDMPIISQTSGLVGLPRPSQIGIDFTMRLAPEIQVGKPLKIESELIPNANGIYYPYALTHRGNFRGEGWYTDIEAYRQGYGA